MQESVVELAWLRGRSLTRLNYQLANKNATTLRTVTARALRYYIPRAPSIYPYPLEGRERERVKGLIVTGTRGDIASGCEQ